MTTRRSFFQALAALVVAPKVLPAVTGGWDMAAPGSDYTVAVMGFRNLIDDGTLSRISGVSRTTYPKLDAKSLQVKAIVDRFAHHTVIEKDPA